MSLSLFAPLPSFSIFILSPSERLLLLRVFAWLMDAFLRRANRRFGMTSSCGVFLPSGFCYQKRRCFPPSSYLIIDTVLLSLVSLERRDRTGKGPFSFGQYGWNSPYRLRPEFESVRFIFCSSFRIRTLVYPLPKLPS